MPGTFGRVLKNLVSPKKDKEATSETDIVSKVQKLYDSRDRSSLEQFHRQWFINIAMRRGHQWLLTNSASREISLPPEEVDRVRMTINKMLPIHLTKLAKLIRETPRWSVDYEDMDDDGKESARADEALLKSIFLSEDMTIEMVEFLGWAIDTGNVFWKVVWDHDAGDELPEVEGLGDEESDEFGEDAPEEPETDEEDAEEDEIEEEAPVFSGDADLITVSPFDIVPSMLGKPLKAQKWIMHVYEADVDDIEEEWGVRVKADGGKDTRDFYQRRLSTMIGVQNEYLGGSNEEPKKNTSLVIEFYERPTKKRPKGTFIAIAGGKWLNKTKSMKPGPLPYKYLIRKRLWFPFVHMKDIPVSGSFFAMGTMENLIAPQKGYNRFWSQVLENANNFGNIKVMADRNADLSTEAFDDTGSEVVYYEANHKPDQLQPAQLPNSVMSQGEMYKGAFEDISGQHEPTNAQAPGGVTSGIALAQLQDQDDTRNAPTLIFFRHAMRKAGEHILCLYREMMSEGEVRSIKFPTSKAGAAQHQYEKISKDSLGDNPAINVTLESTAEWQKQNRRTQIQNSYKDGLFGPQNAPQVQRRVLDALEFGDMKQFFHDNDMDEQNARDNIDRIQDGRDLDQLDEGVAEGPGMPPEPLMGIMAHPWEDHEEHLRVYNSFRKGARYRNEWDDGRKAMLDRLADEHSKMLADSQKAPPPQPNVNISAKTEIPPQTLIDYAGLPQPTPPPTLEPPAPQEGDPASGIPPDLGTGAEQQPESTPTL